MESEIVKINQRLDKMGQLFLELRDAFVTSNGSMETEIVKINQSLNKTGQLFLELRESVAATPEKRYFVAPHASDTTDQLDTAHAASLVELKNVGRLATANRNMYAKIEHCCEYLNPILSKFDLAVTQILSYNEYGNDVLITRLSHKSGQWYESRAILKMDKTGAQSLNQQLGSSITYMRRYALLAILGIGQIDDPTDMDR